jgi:hypothetical protein
MSHLLGDELIQCLRAINTVINDQVYEVRLERAIRIQDNNIYANHTADCGSFFEFYGVFGCVRQEEIRGYHMPRCTYSL